jgi:hypothetical protein
MTRRATVRLMVAALPALAFTLHDLVFQLPDNQHEASAGFFATVIGLLVVWTATGYLSADRSRGAGRALASGALGGTISVAILWLTFIVLNNLFIDRMSYEPDRIRAFRESGDATMREFVNQGLLRGLLLPGLLMCVAAIAGAAGGAVGVLGEDPPRSPSEYSKTGSRD